MTDEKAQRDMLPKNQPLIRQSQMEEHAEFIGKGV
jgi:hypothetical protein